MEEPYKILDVIIEILSGTNYYDSKTLMQKLLESKKLTDERLIYSYSRALNKLKKEGYINTLDGIKNEEGEIENCKIELTFEGELLHRNGNYSKIILDEKIEKYRLLALEISSEKQAHVLNRLTYWIAFATVPMGIYAVFQILEFINNFTE
jgi:hypothetical protein